MQKLKVGVLRGGPSSAYDISLESGSAVLQGLDAEKYAPLDILIDKEGIWHLRGVPQEPARILLNIDVAFNALHGEYGEDGTLQKMLTRFGVPYTGSSALAAALSLNKALARRQLEPHREELGVLLPRHEVLDVEVLKDRSLGKLFGTFAPAVVIKPLSSGASVGVEIARSPESFKEALLRAFMHSPRVLVEEYLEGKEATCAVVESFRGEPLYAFLPVEIVVPPERGFFDHESKREGGARIACPATFGAGEKKQIERTAREAHRVLSLRHYSRSDFIVTPKGIYFLEINALPDLSPRSSFSHALSPVGCTFPQFLDHVLGLALAR